MRVEAASSTSIVKLPRRRVDMARELVQMIATAAANKGSWMNWTAPFFMCSNQAATEARTKFQQNRSPSVEFRILLCTKAL
jgi:hypothetical protein